MSHPSTLPASWVQTTLGALRLNDTSGILPSSQPDTLFDLYSIPNFPTGKPEEILGKEIGSNKQTVKPGMVLLSKINPRINRVWVVGTKGTRPQIASTEWITFAPLPSLDSKYLAYFMRQSTFRDYLAANVAGVGGSLTRTNTAAVDRYTFPLPPLAEQGRIVEKIEELFSKLDAGVAELRRTQGLLKRYRQSLLHAAVTGELSRDWRAQNPATETGHDLLQRLLAERRDRWVKSGKRGKYTEPAAPATEGLPALPEEWTWASVEQLGDVGTGATPLKGERKYYDAGDVPWVTSGALNDDFVREPTGLITELAVKETNVKKFPIGTLLVAMYGEGKTRGKVSELAIEAATNQACAAVKINSSDTLKDFVKLYFKWNYDNIRRASAGGVQPNLSLGIIKAIALPVPPLTEQEFIVAEVERRLSVLDNLEATVAAELKRAESTRQSILHRAFTGQLVPQDPTDEPASALLERIQTERVAAGAAAIRAGTGSGRRGRPRKAQGSDPLLTAEE